MKPTPSKSVTLLAALILLSGLAGGLGMAQAEQHGGHHQMQGAGKDMHGGGKHGGMHGGDEHKGGMHGGMHGGGKHKGGMHGGMHGGGKHKGGRHGGGTHLYGDDWRETLTDEQKKQLDRLHVAYAKTKAPHKARMKALKVELTSLATAAEPNKAAIDAKIEELLQIKRESMRAKYAYIAEQRKVLTTDQQVSFDMQMIHKAMHGKKGKGGHH